MKRNSWMLMISMSALVFMACNAQEAESEGSGAAQMNLDEDCYTACIAKGAAESDCTAYCTEGDDNQGGKGNKPGQAPSKDMPGDGDGKKPNQSTGQGGDNGSDPGSNQGNDPDAPDEDDNPTVTDEEKEEAIANKTCVECWYDESRTQGACAAEAAACQESLACTQLQWCPHICEADDCVSECNDVIPSGVAPLAAIVQCIACDGGPCADACENSVMLAYCD